MNALFTFNLSTVSRAYDFFVAAIVTVNEVIHNVRKNDSESKTNFFVEHLEKLKTNCVNYETTLFIPICIKELLTKVDFQQVLAIDAFAYLRQKLACIILEDICCILLSYFCHSVSKRCFPSMYFICIGFRSRGVFRTQSDIYNGVFCANN